MKIEIGIYRGGSRQSHGWMRVCEQEKFPHRWVDEPETPVVLIEGESPQWLDAYLRGGGIAVMTEATPQGLPFPVTTRGEAVVHRIHLEEAGLDDVEAPCLATMFAGVGWGSVHIHHRRLQKLGIINGRCPVFQLARHGKGLCLYTGLPLTRLLTVEGDTLRKVSHHSDLTERIAAVDKAKITQILVWALRRVFNLAGLPYVHLSYYPQGAPGVYAFRVDVDGTFDDHVVNISRVGKEIGLPITFFVNKSLCKGQEHYLRRIDAFHEIGNHGDIHDLFDDKASNLVNVSRCREWMSENGLVHGPWYAAPRGMYNTSLGLALEELGYEYTSDFGVDVDGLPFFPRVEGGRKLSVLQVPIHPYSIERAAAFAQETGRSKPTARQVLSYFRCVAADLIEQGLPVFFYSHPEYFGEVADRVLPAFRVEMERRGLACTTLSRFAAWWKERDKALFDVRFDREKRRLTIDGAIPSDVHVTVVSSREIGVEGSLAPDLLSFEQPPSPN